jgi:hypothetical protein
VHDSTLFGGVDNGKSPPPRWSSLTPNLKARFPVICSMNSDALDGRSYPAGSE